MSRVYRGNKSKICGNKIGWADQELAKEKAKLSSEKTGEAFAAYRCPHCSRPERDRFHIGHIPQSVKSRNERKKRWIARRKEAKRLELLNVNTDSVTEEQYAESGAG